MKPYFLFLFDVHNYILIKKERDYFRLEIDCCCIFVVNIIVVGLVVNHIFTISTTHSWLLNILVKRYSLSLCNVHIYPLDGT